MDPACRGIKFPMLVGMPGSGKSHVIKLLAAYTISRGLVCELLSYTSHRARLLGGSHLHLVFPLPVIKGHSYTAQGIAQQCLFSLDRDIQKKALLKRIDCLIFEEIGLLSAEYFSAVDSVLRKIMGNSLPWGGKLLISCGDSKQLPPIEGRPIWSSQNMATLMQVIVFRAPVRAQDPELRWLNEQCRRSLSPAESLEFANVVCEHCTFVGSWDLVPDDAVRIVPTRAAEQIVIEKFLSNKQTTSFMAIDEVLNGNVWARATERVTAKLNHDCYEYHNCRLFVPVIVRMTYNERNNVVQFSQGQLAVVVAMPDARTPFLDQRLGLRIAPPGVSRIDTANIPATWPEVLVGPRTCSPMVVGAGLQMGRRTQFPIRYNVSSTIHRIQGETVALYATQLSDKIREYKLWQKEQLAVLISRAQRCADIIFVGSQVETKSAIVHILKADTRWESLIDQYILALDVLTRPPVREIRMENHPLRPMSRELPTASCGYVYLLASNPHPRNIYIGQCEDLKRSLREHNTGYGNEVTRPTSLHPWGVFAFVCGFEDQVSQVGIDRRTQFFHEWQTGVDFTSGPEVAYDRGVLLVQEWQAYNLVIVKCAGMRP
jgi:hypothetical protein